MQSHYVIAAWRNKRTYPWPKLSSNCSSESDPWPNVIYNIQQFEQHICRFHIARENVFATHIPDSGLPSITSHRLGVCPLPLPQPFGWRTVCHMDHLFIAIEWIWSFRNVLFFLPSKWKVEEIPFFFPRDAIFFVLIRTRKICALSRW